MEAAKGAVLVSQTQQHDAIFAIFSVAPEVRSRGDRGIKFASTYLQRSIEGSDPALHDALITAMKEAEANGGMSFGDQVLGVLHQMVLSGSSAADDVARLFGMHERTLRRRLANEGKSLHELIQQTRFELAQQLLENNKYR